MSAPTHELLLALRAPSSGWLAAVICAIDEAVREPSFNAPARDLLVRLLHTGDVPEPVSLAARERMLQFELALRSEFGSPEEVEPPAAEPVRPRPHLTVCGGTGF